MRDAWDGGEIMTTDTLLIGILIFVSVIHVVALLHAARKHDETLVEKIDWEQPCGVKNTQDVIPYRSVPAQYGPEDLSAIKVVGRERRLRFVPGVYGRYETVLLDDDIAVTCRLCGDKMTDTCLFDKESGFHVCQECIRQGFEVKE